METKLWSALIGLSKTVDSNPKTENTDNKETPEVDTIH